MPVKHILTAYLHFLLQKTGLLKTPRPLTVHIGRKHHIVIGASTLMLFASVMMVLLISGKSRKARANDRTVIEIVLPDQTEIANIEKLRVLADIGVKPVSAEEAQEEPDPLSMDVEEPESSVSLPSGTAISVRPGVELTSDLAGFANNLGTYFSEHHLQAMITSGVRSGDHQLEIIKEKISRAGMMRAFPGLVSATVADVNVWTPAWQWLKARRIPVNPPASFINKDGNEVGASLHTKGLALDLVSNNLTALVRQIVQFAGSPLAGGPLRITSLTRERDCVHVALTR